MYPRRDTTCDEDEFRFDDTHAAIEQPFLSIPDGNTFTAYYDPVWREYLRNIICKQNIIRELYYTEWQYAQDMAVVVRIYMCASASANLASRQVEVLFSNITHIMDISLGVLATLGDHIPKRILEGSGRISSEDIIANDELRIGHALCLAFTGEFYEEYERYICHNKAQLDLLSELTGGHSGNAAKSRSRAGSKRSPKTLCMLCSHLLHPHAVDHDRINAWLQQSATRARKFTTAFSLDCLLLKPVQRIGKYPLFLKTIIAYTEPEHSDLSSLRIALTRCTQFLDKINAQLR